HGSCRLLNIDATVSEHVEAERHRREKVGPEPIFSDHLVPFRVGQAGPGRGERGRGDEVRPARFRKIESQTAPDRRGAVTSAIGLGADGISVRFAPPCLTLPSESLPGRGCRIARHAIHAEPAMGNADVVVRSRGHPLTPSTPYRTFSFGS